jgi:hypothetical protein
MASGMVRGRAWGDDEEAKFRQLVDEGRSMNEICKIIVKTGDAVIQKMFDLSLKEKKSTL